MHKLFQRVGTLSAAGLLLSGVLLSQDQPPASSSQQSTPSKNAASSAQKPKTSTPTKKATGTTAQAPLVLKTEKDKFSYALGMNLGNNLKKQSVELDPAIFSRGLKDAMAGKTQMTDDEARSAISVVQNETRAKLEEKKKAEAAANKKEGDEFLAANKSKEGVVVLPSGLQYKILTAGSGPKPTTSDTVVCNYRGKLINGKEFDSSYKRGQPVSFPVGGVIKGWTEALQLMPVGSKWELFIPPDLAYGDRGAGGEIGPEATLIFEVELVSIQPKEEQKPNAPGQEQPKDQMQDQKEPQKQ
jgi:FKBP-type peptidyl-prolyl cis-trans isomerase